MKPFQGKNDSIIPASQGGATRLSPLRLPWAAIFNAFGVKKRIFTNQALQCEDNTQKDTDSTPEVQAYFAKDTDFSAKDGDSTTRIRGIYGIHEISAASYAIMLDESMISPEFITNICISCFYSPCDARYQLGCG